MCTAWSRSRLPTGSIVTNGTSVASSSGSRRDAARSRASSTTPDAKSPGTSSSARNAAKSRGAPAIRCFTVGRSRVGGSGRPGCELARLLGRRAPGGRPLGRSLLGDRLLRGGGRLADGSLLRDGPLGRRLLGDSLLGRRLLGDSLLGRSLLRRRLLGRRLLRDSLLRSGGLLGNRLLRSGGLAGNRLLRGGGLLGRRLLRGGLLGRSLLGRRLLGGGLTGRRLLRWCGHAVCLLGG